MYENNIEGADICYVFMASNKKMTLTLEKLSKKSFTMSLSWSHPMNRARRPLDWPQRFARRAPSPCVGGL